MEQMSTPLLLQTKDFPRIVDLRSNSFDIWCSKYVLDYETNKKNTPLSLPKQVMKTQNHLIAMSF